MTAHLKLGDFQGPLVRQGTADMLYCFELNETYRTLKFLRDAGLCFANVPASCHFDSKIAAHLREREIVLRTFDADARAMEIGAIVTANIILVGYSAGTGLVSFKAEDLREVLKYISPDWLLEKNLRAFEIGLRAGAESPGHDAEGSCSVPKLEKGQNA